jgi:predicted RNA-binding Zn ribbon-like protein
MTVDTEAPLLGEPLPVELMNTVWADRHGRHDALEGDPRRARAWIAAVGNRIGLDGMAGAYDDLQLGSGYRDGQAQAVGAEPLPTQLVESLVDLRDALRRLAAEQTSDPRSRARGGAADLDDAVRVLNETASRGLSWPELAWGPSGVEQSTHADAPLSVVVVATLARAGVSFFAGEDRVGLRACLAPGCVLYFVKQHRRREWCSAACGNRARVARHYERNRA